VTTSDEREQANQYLNSVTNFGSSVGDDFRQTLEQLRQEGEVEVDDYEIEAAATDSAYFAMAQHMTHNPPTEAQGLSFFQKMLARADHPNGPAWSNTTNTSMRKKNAHQRAANTNLENTARARGNDCNLLSEEQQYQMAVHNSLQQQQQQESLSFSERDTNLAIQQSLGNSYSVAGLSMQSHHSNNYQMNHQPAHSNSISPMPSVSTKSFATTLQPPTIETPQHVKKMRDALMEYSLGLDGDGEGSFDEEVDDEAIAAFEAFGNTEDPTHKTLHQYAKKLHDKNDMTTPIKVRKLVSVYKASSKKKK
jgi:hypothetical protein